MRRALVLLLLLACVEQKAPVRSAPQSIRLRITAPPSLGTREQPLTSRDVTFDVELLGADGRVVPVDRDLELNTWFLGSLGRSFGTAPDTRCRGLTPAPIHLTQGRATGVHVTLPLAYGPVNLWLEDCHEPGASWAVGASDPLWFPYPTIQDVQKPLDLSTFDFRIFVDSPLEGKQVQIDASPTGKMVVTGVFPQFYTITDTGLAAWNSLYVYSFSKPRVRVGDVIIGQSLTGSISEFVGMTELNFPLAQVDFAQSPSPLPPPVPMTIADFNYGTDATKAARLESLEAAIVELQDGCVCPVDSSYTQFQEWKLAFKRQGVYNCGQSYAMTMSTAGVVAGWDPPQAGRHVSIARGVLANLAGLASRTSGNPFSFFVLHPRNPSDLVDAGDTCTTM